jgi:cytochrome P450
MRGWVLTRYSDAVCLLHDHRFGRDGYVDGLQRRFGSGALLEAFTHDLGFMDPPEHTRLRALVVKAFTPDAVESVRSHIRKITESLLDRVQKYGGMNVISELAFPLPLAVIAEMLGLPEGDRASFGQWVHDVVRARGLVHTADVLTSANVAVERMSLRLEQLIRERQAEPRQDLLTTLSTVEAEGERLSHAELISTVMALWGAGHETTKNLIGSGVLALLRNRDQLALLHDKPESIESAVEEFLRYDSPTQAPPPRIAMEDVIIGGETISRGEAVSPLLGACNRDPEQFPEPDRLNILRHPNHHLAFSLGAHFCLGAGLARAEAQIAIGTLAGC